MRASTLLRIILAIQQLVVRSFCFEDLGLVVEVVPRSKSARCGECGRGARRVRDRRARRWRHLDVAGMTVHLRYAIHRVHCDACEAVKTEQVSWASAGSNFTQPFEKRTAYLAQQSSRTAVSRVLLVTWRTVGGIITRAVRDKLEGSGDRLEGLRHIGIDELS